MNGSCSPCAPMSDEDRKYEKYEVESACDCLIRAETIRKDAKMMGLVQPILDEKMAAMKKITSIDGLKKRSKELDAKES